MLSFEGNDLWFVDTPSTFQIPTLDCVKAASHLTSITALCWTVYVRMDNALIRREVSTVNVTWDTATTRLAIVLVSMSSLGLPCRARYRRLKWYMIAKFTADHDKEVW